MVFSSSRALLAARNDLAPHMVKWWKGLKPSEGMVTRSLSPYEQKTVVPLLRSLPKKLYEDFTGSYLWLGGALALTFGTAILADEADAAQDRSHRY